ncbi:MAG: hypothetical protein KDC67_12865 [Ignavibacteriae bacterium]|nr:hypothetical protein [Ignavibacteriota bacterium]
MKSEISSELEKTRKTIEKAADTMAKAVPGERYLRLIDGMANDETREETKKLIENIFGVKIDHKTLINISFGYGDIDQSVGPLEGSAFISRSNDRNAVVMAIKSNLISGLQSVKSKSISPYTDREIRSKINALVTQFFVNINGQIDVSNLAFNVRKPRWTRSAADNIKEIKMGMAGLVNAFNDEPYPLSNNIQQIKDYYLRQSQCSQQKIIKPLVDAISAEYEQRPINSGKGDIVKEWNFTQGRFLIILLNKNQFEHYKENLDLRYTLEIYDQNNNVIDRKVSDPISTSNFTRTIQNQEKLPVYHPLLEKELVWAAFNLNGTVLTPEEYAYYTSLDQLIQKLEQIEKQQYKKSVKEHQTIKEKKNG